MLRINDLFWTIQGEGKNAGTRALFVRMPYCNYSCTWCDTTFNTYKEWEKSEFYEFISTEKARLAILTGGEPLMNKQLPEIIEILKSKNFTIAVESNGSFPPVDGIDFYTVSPKRDVQKGLPEYFINPALTEVVSEYKYVVDKEFDFKILDRHKQEICRKNLSPEFNDFKNNVDKIIEYIKENPEWQISLQTHKWMNVA